MVLKEHGYIIFVPVLIKEILSLDQDDNILSNILFWKGSGCFGQKIIQSFVGTI